VEGLVERASTVVFGVFGSRRIAIASYHAIVIDY